MDKIKSINIITFPKEAEITVKDIEQCLDDETKRLSSLRKLYPLVGAKL
jgi:hypothetical protein